MGDAGSHVSIDGGVRSESSCDTSEDEHGDCREFVENFILCSQLALQRAGTHVYRTTTTMTVMNTKMQRVGAEKWEKNSNAEDKNFSGDDQLFDEAIIEWAM